MKEDFLNFIWKHQYFDKTKLTTIKGVPLQILDPGHLNVYSGPDFCNAHIKIANTHWVGSVEIHIRSSDWNHHHHQQDPAYQQVVLHVVWINNLRILNNIKQEIPTLELKGKVERALLYNHERLRLSTLAMPCGPQAAGIPEHSFTEMMNITFKQRIERRSLAILDQLVSNQRHWDETTYLVIGKNFGFHINSASFQQLVRLVPLSVARKLRANLFQLEALYFGQAGFLQGISGDGYYQKLQKEYQFLKRKFSLPPGMLNQTQWRYLRLRPSNFPSVRIAQFTAFIHGRGYRFSKIKEMSCASELQSWSICPSPYWQFHYDFGKSRKKRTCCLGKSAKENLIINSVVPLLVAYSVYSGQLAYKNRALEILSQVSCEENHVSRYWKDKGFKLSSGLHSQALMELNNQYCRLRKCLDCRIGQSLLTSKNTF